MTRTSPARWLIAPVFAAIVVAGVWVTGGLLTNDFKASAALTALWFAASGAACLAIGLRWRRVRVPTLAAYLATAAAVGGYLAWTTLRDTVVHERLPVGVEILGGTFESVEHHSSGRAAVIRLPGGGRRLTLSRFATSPGPDLRVRLVVGRSENGASAGARDLGALKGNKGDQQYAIPAGLAVSGHSAVIWCRAFSAPFGSALLRSP